MENLQPTGQDHLSAAQQLLDDDRHFVQAVTRMGDDQEVVAVEDIFEIHGVKLLARGSRINSAVLDKLLGHRLREPIETRLTADAGVSPTELANAAAQFVDTDAWWRRMAARSGDAMAIRHGLSRLKIPAPLCFRLTVLREQRPALYLHSLRTALLSHYLALRLGLSATDTERLLLAALCHDFGELHTDPAILEPGHRITDEERRFVYVHPVTGYLILNHISAVHPEVARAVLHHHERLDGSGYPSRLRGDAISRLARILTVAEVAETILARFADNRRLSALLRLNLSKYDVHAVAMLHELLLVDPDLGRKNAALPPDALNRQLSLLSGLLSGWARFRTSLDEPALADAGASLDFLFERIQNLNSTLRQFGFDPDSFETLSTLAREHPEIASELAVVVEEMTFQLAEIAREIARREDAGELNLRADTLEALAYWKKALMAALADS